MKNKNMIIMAIIVVVVAAASFYGGTLYQKSRRVTFSLGQGGPNGATGARFGANGAQRGPGTGGANGQFTRPINGEISAVDGDSITVKLPDGSSKIVIVSDKTMINKATTSERSDLKVGEKITAFGVADQTGAITAQSVSIGTTMMPMPTQTK